MHLHLLRSEIVKFLLQGANLGCICFILFIAAYEVRDKLILLCSPVCRKLIALFLQLGIESLNVLISVEKLDKPVQRFLHAVTTHTIQRSLLSTHIAFSMHPKETTQYGLEGQAGIVNAIFFFKPLNKFAFALRLSGQNIPVCAHLNGVRISGISCKMVFLPVKFKNEENSMVSHMLYAITFDICTSTEHKVDNL